MTNREANLPSFDPPSISENPEYILYQGDLHILPAKKLVKRLQDAELDVFMERNPSGHLLPQSFGQFVYNVSVAQSHFLCALIVWRLRGRGIDAWQTMNRAQRIKIAVKALADGALIVGGAWDPSFFPAESLAWLQFQLGVKADGFRRILAQARARFEQIARRDLRWGMWITAACLIIGPAWGWAASFGIWQVWSLIIIGVVVGVYTLIYSLPRVIRITASRSGTGNQFRDSVQVRSRKNEKSNNIRPRNYESSTAVPQTARKAVSGESYNPYPDLVQSLDKAKEFLNRGDAGAALNVLKAFESRDIRGVHTAYPEFYKLLQVCENSLGLNTRNTSSQIEEMGLDWLAALKKGEELLRAGKAKESIAYFTRSISSNPGEAGTASHETAARQGIKTAEALLKRKKKRNGMCLNVFLISAAMTEPSLPRLQIFFRRAKWSGSTLPKE